MNYAALSLDRLAWIATAKGSKAYYGAAKFAFQTPRFAARLEHFYKIPGSMTLTTDERELDHAPGFLEFLRTLEASASRSLGYGGIPASFAMKKLTTFDTTEIFDGSGRYVVAPEEQFDAGVYDVTCLLQLTGTWKTSSVWGLRLKVVQLKIHGPGSLLPPAAAAYNFVESSGEEDEFVATAVPAAAWSFVESDDDESHKCSEATV